VSYDVVAIGVPANLEEAGDLLSSGRRLARLLGARWIALLVQKRSMSGRRSSSRESLRRELARLVSDVGGELRCTTAEDVGQGLVEASREACANILVIGPSKRPRFLRRLRPGTTETILRTPRSFDVIVASRGARA